MRVTRKLAAGALVVAAATVMTAGPALADPPPGTQPKASDIVGLADASMQTVENGLAADYDATHKKGPRLYIWNPAAAGASPQITVKKGCKPMPRPASPSPSLLTQSPPDGSHFCIDFVSSETGPRSTDPPGITFAPLALDNVTYASVAKHTNAPGNLTVKQLRAIYTCSATKWTQVGGKSSATIHPLLAQPGSAAGADFLRAIGVTTPGPCVDQPSTLAEDEGINPIFKGASAPNEIIPFSSALWVAQAFHSPACKTAGCVNSKTGAVDCRPPTKAQNKFGCDVNGPLKLNSVNGTPPTTGSGTKTVLNPKFAPVLIRTVFDVVRTARTKDGIPAYLDPILGPTGYFCSKAARPSLTDYGFEPTASCG